jgi:hypothetical protein
MGQIISKHPDVAHHEPDEAARIDGVSDGVEAGLTVWTLVPI